MGNCDGDTHITPPDAIVISRASSIQDSVGPGSVVETLMSSSARARVSS